jgi:hypothetical protein
MTDEVKATDESLDTLVRAEQVAGLYARSALPFVTNFVNASILGYLLRGFAGDSTTLAWLASCYGTTALRVVLWRVHRRLAPEPSGAHTWGRLYTVGIALSATAWGSSAFVLYPRGEIIPQVVILLVLGGMAAGAAASAATFFPAFLAFLVPALAPMAIRLLAEGDRVHVGLGAMSVLFGVAMSNIARSG